MERVLVYRRRLSHGNELRVSCDGPAFGTQEREPLKVGSGLG
jgi:hypothetical protein